MPMDAHDIEAMIKAAIPDAEVTIRDLAGDGDHYAATVISNPSAASRASSSTRSSISPCRARWGRPARAGAANRRARHLT